MIVNPIFYQNEINKYQNIQKEYQALRRHSCNEDESASIYDMLPPANRFTSVDKEIDENNFLSNAGLITMAAVNLPEDIRDLKEMAKQLEAKLKKDKTFNPAYDYSKAQHPFSFFRGTLLERLANPKKSLSPKFAEWLKNADRTLLDTRIGKNFLEKNNIDIVDNITSIEDIQLLSGKKSKVIAKQIIGGTPFGEITARAMLRTPVLGVATYGGIEAIKCIEDISDGKNPFKTIYNSAVDFSATTIGMAYGGAFGAKHFGAAGSLLGMGIGTILGKLTAKELKVKNPCKVCQDKGLKL